MMEVCVFTFLLPKGTGQAQVAERFRAEQEASCTPECMVRGCLWLEQMCILTEIIFSCWTTEM